MNGFVRPSLSELAARVRADFDTRLPGADSRLRRNALDVLAGAHAGAMHAAYGMLDQMSRFLPDEAQGDMLLRRAAEYGLTIKPATAATGQVTFTGTNGVEVEAGAILVRADGVRFATDADVTIAGGVATADVTAEEAGDAAATETGQLLTFLSPVAGVGAIATVAAPGIAGGADEEDPEDLRARLLQRIRNPIRGGAKSDYVAWALEVPGVTRAWVYENWDGLGTVKVLFVMDGREDIIPAGGDVTDVADHIDPLRPVCADVTVAAPVADELDLTIDLTPDTPEIRAAIEAELRDLISREAEPGGTLLISHIREAISIAAGEIDHTLTTPSANVTAAAGEITVLGTITWA